MVVEADGAEANRMGSSPSDKARTPSQEVSLEERLDIEGDEACELLLAFVRLARGKRHESDLPKQLEELVRSGLLAPRHLAAFAVIAIKGPLTVSDLANHEGLALSTASLLVTQLFDVGLVDRREDEEDRRRTLVSIAPDHLGESQAVLRSKLAPLRRALYRMGPVRSEAMIEGMHILAEEIACDDEVVSSGTQGDANVINDKEEK
ncbi:MAG: MarR family transcriptional regulator [Actinobacteria bacterium]|nr:MarR family transcriptional regulator [Actinomycetota bacterium]